MASDAATVDAVEAVGLSPSEEKSSPKRRRKMQSLNPELQAATAAGAAVLATDEK